MVLSYSLKAYSEAVLRQDTETFLRCLESGLRAFGGVPPTGCTNDPNAAQRRDCCGRTALKGSPLDLAEQLDLGLDLCRTAKDHCGAQIRAI
jgi:transposase